MAGFLCRALTTAVIGVVLGTQAAGADPLDGGLIPTDHILMPAEGNEGTVVLFSDIAGWGAPEETLAVALRDKGAAVIGIDLPGYLARLDASSDECVYLIADIERLSQQIARNSGGAVYHAPILAGAGVAGGLALDLLDQTPAATVGGTVVTDPSVGIPMDKSLCTSAHHTEGPGGAVYELPVGSPSDPVSIGLSARAGADTRDRVAKFDGGASRVTVDNDATPGTAGLKDAILAMLADTNATPGSLPIVELPATPTHGVMAIVLSGDGGWRDLDRTIGGILQQQGVPTIGFDSLRYFWTERTPQETADDLAAIARKYSRDWGVQDIALIGYSFGADVLPAAYLALDPETRARVRLISLLGPSDKADWEITVSGWLGSSSSAATPTGPALTQLPAPKLQCIYGKEEDGSPCPTLATAEVIGTDGGHHFDGDYTHLAQVIIDGIDRREMVARAE